MKKYFSELKMKKSTIIIIGCACVIYFLFGISILTSLLTDKHSISRSEKQSVEEVKKSTSVEIKKVVCDGIKITNNCEYDNVEYAIYKYYPAEEEKSHVEKKVTTTREVTGYCTLCNDGTYSPSCATGRGACSHHGGVAEWNAPIYRDVNHYEDVKVIDSPAVPEKYEKVLKVTN